MLLVVALFEVVVDRVAVPLLRPAKGAPPLWHALLDNVGLFTFYFVSALAALITAHRIWLVLRRKQFDLRAVAFGIVGVATLLAVRPLLLDSSTTYALAIEVAYALALLALIAANISGTRDLGVQLGLGVLVAPLLVHSVTVLGGLFLFSADPYDGPVRWLVKLGLTTTCVAALLTPYCFAPRPFARAVTRPLPLVTAMCIASIGAVLSRGFYPVVAKAAKLATGFELHVGAADPQLALYLLSFATLSWTLVSCAMSAAPSRRQIGVGILFIVLGGYGFEWPHHFLLPLLGLVLVVEAGATVRDEELAAMPFETDAPPVDDTTWAAYIASVSQGARRLLGGVHSLTTRGEGGIASSVVIGEARGVPVRVRIERIGGAAVALDIVLGREVDELRGATLCMLAIPAKEHGAAPPGPPAAPAFKTGDAEFDARFAARGSEIAFGKLLDEELRARALASLDGWLAYWDRESVRYRVYPGRGAPLDHPLPLGDLATGRVPSAERLLAVIELLIDIAARADLETTPSKPSELDA